MKISVKPLAWGFSLSPHRAPLRVRAGRRWLLRRLLKRPGHVAQLLARLESDRETGRNLHYLHGVFWVATDPAFLGLHEEHAEAAQLDALAARQRLAQHIDDCLDGLRRLLALQAGRLRDRAHDVVLDHLGESLHRRAPARPLPLAVSPWAFRVRE